MCIGGATPCFMTFPNALTPPPIPLGAGDSAPASASGEATPTTKPTSAVVNVAYAIHYPVTSAGGSKLSVGAKAGIGAGAGLVALVIAAVLIYLIRKSRRRKKDREILDSLRGSGWGSSGMPSTPHTSQLMPQMSPLDPTTDAFGRRRSPTVGNEGQYRQSYFPPVNHVSSIAGLQAGAPPASNQHQNPSLSSSPPLQSPTSPISPQAAIVPSANVSAPGAFEMPGQEPITRYEM
ncbi:MAG: hypothetical protein M1825_001903 [Sarcosagium campestre]|nr:MAG: hypothetical protein M1825_001903 [Sarcosagium campestre]